MVLLVLLAPVAAEAAIDDRVTHRLPDATAIAHPLVLTSQVAAAAYWTRQGKTSPCPSTTVVATNMLEPGVAARTYAWACTMALANAFAEPRLHAGLRARRQLCTVIVHEQGHVIGLDHDQGGGIMDPDHMYDATPAECRQAFPLPRRLVRANIAVRSGELAGVIRLPVER